jgi:hypothetical protein
MRPRLPAAEPAGAVRHGGGNHPSPSLPGRRAGRHRWARGANGRSAWCAPATGDLRHLHDAIRSIPLLTLAPLLSLPDTTAVLLQAKLRQDDRAAREQFPHLRVPSATLADYADRAALIAQLDLIITVDTSVAQFTATLGRPVRVMLPHAADHRWMVGRSGSPWYPSMTLYRQSKPGIGIRSSRQ